MASAAPLTPGSVATFWIWSSEWSEAICSIRSRSANTRAGTRMSARASGESSHTTSSTWRKPLMVSARSSDIEDHRSPVPLRRGLEGQAVIGGALDQMAGPGPGEGDLARQPPLAQLNRHDPGGGQIRCLRGIDQLIQKGHEERRLVGCGQLKPPHNLLAAGIVGQQLRAGAQRLPEYPRLGLGFDLQLKLGGVIDPAVAQLTLRRNPVTRRPEPLSSSTPATRRERRPASWPPSGSSRRPR